MFRSPTFGLRSLEQVARDILEERTRHPESEYRLIIGTDSQPKGSRSEATFVTAIILHRLGHGGKYFVHKEHHHHMYALKQRMFTEASLSIQACGLLMQELEPEEKNWHIEVHLDIGEHGETKQWIREIVAWIEGNGYLARIKPDSFGASKVADRYTKA